MNDQVFHLYFTFIGSEVNNIRSRNLVTYTTLIINKRIRKHYCPNCNKKSFVKFIDTDTNEILPDQYGRCDKSDRCGYFLTPYGDYKLEDYKNWTPPKPKPKPKLTYIPKELFEATREGYNQNVFLFNLQRTYSKPLVEEVSNLYGLGTFTSPQILGAVTFPYIDILGNIRAIQVKEFDENQKTTPYGNRWFHSEYEKLLKKESSPIPQWLTDYKNNEKIVSCLFGEHLLSLYPNNPIALVEAPKTAIYGCLQFGLPTTDKDYLWLGVFNKSSLNYSKCKSLIGRKVMLYPDLSKDGNTFKLWSEKAKELNQMVQNSSFEVSDLLEQIANNEERENGLDLADFIIKNNQKPNYLGY